MKKLKRFLGVLLVIIMMFSAASCGDEPQTPDDKPTPAKIYSLEFDEVAQEQDMQKFWNETRINLGGGRTTSNDGPLDYGFVQSVYHSLKVNDVQVPVYSTRCGYNVHSFSWVDVEAEGEFELNVELTLLQGDKEFCVVLPEKTQVSATLEGNVATAKITDYGDYSFTFDDQAEMAMTLIVAPKEDLVISQGYTVQYIEPGEYTRQETYFTETNKVYYFKTGVYDVTSIALPSDSIMYVERGAHFRVYQDGDNDHYAALYNLGSQNIKVLGRGIFDFSQCVGGDNKTKGVFSFSNCQNIEFSGIISINSNNWTLCFWYCKDVKVNRNMLLGYRTYSDGVMFSDCKNSWAKNCFVRTGDDAMEVKAFTASTNADCYTDNVLFENNSVWTDKGIAYGVIYESLHKVENVYFKNNSVGFAQAAWSDHLGICVIQMGSDKSATWQKVYFENIEAYKINASLISVFNRANNNNEGGLIKDIYFKNIKAKYAEQTNLPVYAINIVIRILNDAQGTNSRIGRLYIDNVEFAGVAITPENYQEYLNCDISEQATFSFNNIKINTLN